MTFKEFILTLVGGSSAVLIVQHVLSWLSGQGQAHNDRFQVLFSYFKNEVLEKQKRILEFQRREDVCNKRLMKALRSKSYYEGLLRANDISFISDDTPPDDTPTPEC